jgi:hypothetical protein
VFVFQRLSLSIRNPVLCAKACLDIFLVFLYIVAVSNLAKTACMVQVETLIGEHMRVKQNHGDLIWGWLNIARSRLCHSAVAPGANGSMERR